MTRKQICERTMRILCVFLCFQCVCCENYILTNNTSAAGDMVATSIASTGNSASEFCVAGYIVIDTYNYLTESWVAKYDSSGNTIYSYTSQFTGNDYAVEVLGNDNGDCVVVGYTYGLCEGISNGKPRTMIFWYDESANIRRFCVEVGFIPFGATYDTEFNIIVYGNGSVSKFSTVSGSIIYTHNFFNTSFPVIVTDILKPDNEYFLATTNASSNHDCIIFHHDFVTGEGNVYNLSLPEDDYCYKTVRSNGNIYVVGKVFKNGNFDLRLVGFHEDSFTIFVDKTYGGLNNDSGEHIVNYFDKMLAILGTTESYGNGSSDIWLLITDPQGEVRRNITFGDTLDDVGKGLLIINDRIVIVGYTTLPGDNKAYYYYYSCSKNKREAGNVIKYTNELGECESCPSYSYLVSVSGSVTDGCRFCFPEIGCANCEDSYLFIYPGPNRGCVDANPIGFYPDYTAHTCYTCPEKCYHCDTLTLCKQCADGLVYREWNDTHASCFDTCPEDTYTSLDARSCIGCPLYCANCTNSSYCGLCKPNYFMQKLDQFTQYCTDVCIDGYYSEPGLPDCQQCFLNCEKCTNGTSCITCSNLYYRKCNLGMDKCLCVSDCGLGYYPDSSTFMCFLCDFRCAVCNDGTSASCSSCSNDNHVEKIGASECACSSGYYADIVNKKCMLINPNCAVADPNNSSLCMKCSVTISGIALNLATKKCECPSGTFLEGNRCLACSSLCRECTGLTNLDCVSSQCKRLLAYPVEGQLTTCLYMCSHPTMDFILNKTTYHCEQLNCYPTCGKCIGPGTNDCVTCKNSSLVQYKGSCLANCPSNYYIEEGVCYSCADSCEKCYDIKTCTKCKSAFLLQNNMCVSKCSEGYWDSKDKHCTKCGDNCKSCKSTTCDKCADKYYLHDGECKESSSLPAEFYMSKFDYAGFFLPCAQGCLSCAGATKTECKICDSKIRYIQVAPEICSKFICTLGYFIQTDLSGKQNPYCSSCHKSCSSCFNGNETSCISCSEGYVSVPTMNGTLCKACEEIGTGLILDPYSKAKCIGKCGDGKNYGEVECDDGNTVSGDGCSMACEIELGYSCVRNSNLTDICFKSTPPIPRVSVLANNSMAIIYFSKPVYFSNLRSKIEAISSLSFSIVNTADSFCKANLTLNQGKWISSIKKLNLNLSTNCSMLGFGNEILSVNFRKEWLFRDSNNISITTGRITTLMKRTIRLSPVEMKVAKNLGLTCNLATIILLMVSFLRYLIQSIALGSFWSLMNMLQIMYYSSAMSIYLPPNLYIFLNDYLVIAQMQIPFLSIVPEDWINQFKNGLDANISDPILVNFGLVSYSFLYNFFQQFFTWITIALGYVTLSILDTILPQDRFLFIRKWKADYTFNAVIRTLIESLLDMAFLSFLNLNFYESKSTLNSLSYFVSICSMAILAYFFVVCSELTSLLPEDYEDSEFKDKYASLTDEFKENEGSFSRGYYCLFTLKRVAYAFVLAALTSYPTVQVLVILSLDIFMFAYMVYCKPYKSSVDNYINSFHELVQLIIHGLLIIIKMNSLEDTAAAVNLGWTAVALLLLSVLQVWTCLIAPFVYSAFLEIKKYIICQKNPAETSRVSGKANAENVGEISEVKVKKTSRKTRRQAQSQRQRQDQNKKDKEADDSCKDIVLDSPGKLPQIEQERYNERTIKEFGPAITFGANIIQNQALIDPPKYNSGVAELKTKASISNQEQPNKKARQKKKKRSTKIKTKTSIMKKE